MCLKVIEMLAATNVGPNTRHRFYAMNAAKFQGFLAITERQIYPTSSKLVPAASQAPNDHVLALIANGICASKNKPNVAANAAVAPSVK